MKRKQKYKWNSWQKKRIQSILFREPYLVASITWIVLIMFIIPIIESNFFYLRDLTWLFVLISIAIGIYCSYRVVKFIDNRLPKSEMGLWSLRLVSIGLVIIGIFLTLGALWTLSFALIYNPTASFIGFGTLWISFFGSLIIFAGYLEFLFESRSGILIFQGRQRF